MSSTVLRAADIRHTEVLLTSQVRSSLNPINPDVVLGPSPFVQRSRTNKKTIRISFSLAKSLFLTSRDLVKLSQIFYTPTNDGHITPFEKEIFFFVTYLFYIYETCSDLTLISQKNLGLKFHIALDLKTSYNHFTHLIYPFYTFLCPCKYNFHQKITSDTS